VVLALLAFKPQTVLFFLLVLLLRREWRALAASAATGAVLLVLSFALVGAQGLIAYAQTLNQVAQWICTNGVHLEMHQSLRGLFVGLLVPRCSLGQSESAMAPALAQADLLANVLSLAVALSLLAIWWRWRKARADSPQFDLAFAATGLAALLASPYVHPQDLTQLVLTLALVLRAGRALPVGRVPTPLPVAGWVGLALLLGPLTMTPAAFSLHPFVLFMAAMYVLLAYALLRLAPTAVTVGADRAER
jgi:hypothetical protein